MPSSPFHRSVVCVIPFAVALGVPSASAADQSVPQGLVNLSSSATLEVNRDVLGITFGTFREGADASVVQTQLKQALDLALVEARKVARPGQVDLQTGNFTLTPRYVKGVTSGWQGSVELTVEGRDTQAIAQLAGRIGTLTISRLGYSISRELREKTEGEVSAEAIARYRAKAADYAKQFGYAGYTIREVNVSGAEQAPMPRPMLMQAKSASVASDEALSVEPGRGTVTVSVSGTVQMVR